MADDVTFQSTTLATPAVGTIVAGDLISGVIYQRVKPVYGVDGSATDVSSTNPFPVSLINGTVSAVQSGAWSITNVGSVTTVNAVTTVGTVNTVTAVTTVGTVNTVTAVTTVGTVNTVSAVTTVAAVTAITNALPAGTNTIGKTYAAAQTTKALTNANLSFSASGDNILVGSTAAQTIRTFIGCLTSASSVTVAIKDGAGGTTLATVVLGGSGASFSYDTIAAGEPLWVTTAGSALVANLSTGVLVQGFLQYVKS